MLKAPPERSRANVLSVPSGVPFLEIIADDLLDGGLLPGVSLRHDPLGLSDAAIYLPTRRAVRELEAIFARKLGGAALLPRIAALGDFDEDEDVFDRVSLEGEAAGLPRAIGETERRLVLAKLIRRWAEALRNAKTDPAEADLISTSPAEAMSLAIELGGLIDSFETEGVPWTKLVGLVPPEHDRIWELTTTFLNIAAEAWPQHLKENGKIGEAERRNKTASRPRHAHPRKTSLEPDHHRRIDRFQSRDCRTDGRRRTPATWRCRAAGTGCEGRRDGLGRDWRRTA